MKKILLIVFILNIISTLLFSEEIITLTNGKKVVLYDDFTWGYLSAKQIDKNELLKQYKSQLRQGIKASDEDIAIACEMIQQGWQYTMPEPKSPKANWGNNDGRTTWWNGWWYNNNTGQYSESTPQKTNNGLYLGDNQDKSNTWRNGGSPYKPDIFMFLLSENGGPNYY